ncbi:cobalamin-dependent protein [Streptomyces sp. NBC_01220]|uniref:Cobalamin-dependent protein n=1 Tax=Streptomyces poriferorum TaxID=2798799 RepID=A0ABY9ILR8_9ACTN|nr:MULTISPECIES: cobalamin-dependent protein [Streptomyces]MDP5314854.1 cobalamin-dependent protein [Streptomyces sp. Alt4]WLQ56257.1 cobalamin-dependent protein [Streptomyces sp. Alt2]WSI65902.1 cobalamin-dependent protein [Streptomyces sp. NBC_01336]WSQ43608.1 cobalamin-dependent protein [Streptomyces sp. NBC_01220]
MSAGLMHGATNTVSPAGARRGTVVVTTVASDSHTWNLVFLQLLIEELGYEVINLGPCVPDQVLIDACRETAPDLVVISSVNGHGHQDGLRVIDALRACGELASTPVVIGGKLGVAGHQSDAAIGELMSAGFDAVFDDSSSTTREFSRFVGTLSPAARPLERTEVVA